MIVTAAIWLVFVVAAVRPPVRRGPPLGFVVFVATMSFNEIPAVLLVVFVVSMIFSGRPVGIQHGVACVLLIAATAVGFVWLQVRARTARNAFRVALGQGLGWPRQNAQQNEARLGQHPYRPWLRGILLPFERRSRGVARTRNVPYGPDNAHRVDIYSGPRSNTVRPVLIHLHGGGFVSGRKSRESVAMLNQLAENGWLCLSGNYRLRGSGQHPNPLIDAKRLIAWTRSHADRLGADPSSVFLAGCSAGAHVAVCAALTPNLSELQAGFEKAETSVAGVIALYGYLGARTADPSSSPALLAGPDAPPMLIVHGTDDTAVPVSETRAVAAVLGRASLSPVVFVELPRTQHSFDRFASVRARMTADAVEGFLDWARASRTT